MIWGSGKSFPVSGEDFSYAAIVYRVGETTIDILAVYHGGRDMRALGER